jgi:hypothetical protein
MKLLVGKLLMKLRMCSVYMETTVLTVIEDTHIINSI